MDARPGPESKVIVIEGPPGCSRVEVHQLRVRGLTIVDGFRPPAQAARVVCIGVVDDASSAAQAVLAVLGGAGVVVEARADRAVVDRLVDDLRRLGAVDHRVVEPGLAGSLEPEVSIEARAIIGLLALGLSLGEAARILGLARRTADRRLAEARRGLGVTRTTEAIARARRLGWLDREPDRAPIPGLARDD